MKPLSIDKAVDKNLKPVKDSDGTLTALEVSTDKVRVKDFAVAGNISSPLKVDGDFILDASGDITLDADGGDIVFAGAGTSYLTWTANGILRMLAALDTDDFLSFEVMSNGISTIATNDDTGGNLANLFIAVEGDLILDSKNGVFIQKNNGTEFSATNSAYAGMILGYTSVLNDAGDTSYSVTDSFATIHATANITFVAPPSGNVEIFVSVYAKSTATRQLYFGLSDNATYNTIDVTHEHEVWIGDETDEETFNHHWVITGLTSGTSYTYFLGAKADQAGRVSLHWGGDVTGEYAPFIMKATALPATIYDGT